MTKTNQITELPEEIIFGDNGKSLLAWLGEQESEIKDAGIELIQNGEKELGANKILTSIGISEIISLVEAMRRGIDDKNRPKK